jgi:hypothetical protein
MLIGAGTGAGFAIGVGVAQSFEETVPARGDILNTAFGGGGALVGTLTGRALTKPRDEILYQAVQLD